MTLTFFGSRDVIGHVSTGLAIYRLVNGHGPLKVMVYHQNMYIVG